MSAAPDFPHLSPMEKENGIESSAERWANVITHGLGVIGAIIASIFLILAANSLIGYITAAIFGLTLILLYLASTLYHLMLSEKNQARFKIFDHACIYLLIAGTYTPLTLVGLRGIWGWSIFGVIWGLAIGGVLWKAFKLDKGGHWVSTGLYLVMGWMVLIAAKPMWDNLSHGALIWIALGGLSYTIGVIFFAWKSLKFSHAIWHLFVLGGSACHIIATANYVLGQS